jgi:hypothetical protein
MNIPITEKNNSNKCALQLHNFMSTFLEKKKESQIKSLQQKFIKLGTTPEICSTVLQNFPIFQNDNSKIVRDNSSCNHNFQPNCQPNCQPDRQANRQPNCLPKSEPNCLPKSEPNCLPKSEPNCNPICQPNCNPICQPNCNPICQPNCNPICQPNPKQNQESCTNHNEQQLCICTEISIDKNKSTKKLKNNKTWISQKSVSGLSGPCLMVSAHFNNYYVLLLKICNLTFGDGLNLGIKVLKSKMDYFALEHIQLDFWPLFQTAAKNATNLNLGLHLVMFTFCKSVPHQKLKKYYKKVKKKLWQPFFSKKPGAERGLTFFKSPHTLMYTNNMPNQPKMLFSISNLMDFLYYLLINFASELVIEIKEINEFLSIVHFSKYILEHWFPNKIITISCVTDYTIDPESVIVKQILEKTQSINNLLLYANRISIFFLKQI